MDNNQEKGKLLNESANSSVVKDCLFIARDGECLVHANGLVGTYLTLDRYAIIPIERYEELTRTNE